MPRVCFSLSRDHLVSSIHSCQQQQPPLPLHTKLVVVVVRVKVCLINFSIWGGVFHTPPSTTVYILKCLLHTGRTYLRSPQFNDDDTKCQSLTAREDGSLFSYGPPGDKRWRITNRANPETKYGRL